MTEAISLLLAMLIFFGVLLSRILSTLREIRDDAREGLEPVAGPALAIGDRFG